MSKHTPGPWRAAIQDDVLIAKVYGPKHADGGNYAPLMETTNHADARLIAAAPELLESLVRLVAVSGTHIDRNCRCECCEATAQAHAAIDKAEGK